MRQLMISSTKLCELGRGKRRVRQRWFAAWLLLGAFLCGALFGAAEARADARGHYAFRSYGSEDGLDNQSTWYVHQDRQGFLWVATEDGIYRLEGERFRRFDEAQGLESQILRSVYSDRVGQIWVGGRRGIARFTGERFESYGPERGLPEEDIYHIAQAADGPLWVATDRAPYRLNGARHFEPVPTYPFDNCQAVAASATSARMWVSAHAGTPATARVLSYENNEWREWTFRGSPPPDAVSDVIEDPRGRVWARSRTELWVLDVGADHFRRFLADLPVPEGRGRLALDNRGQLLIPTQLGIHWLTENGLLTIGTREGLPTEWARHATVDHEGSLWIAGMGVYRMLGRGLWETFTVKDGLPSQMAWGIRRDAKQRLWIGTNRGLALQAAETWRVVPGTEGYTVQSIVEAADGSLLLAGVPPQVLRYYPDTQELVKFGGEITGASYLFRLLVDDEQTVWLASEGAGLWRASLRAATPRFTREELPAGTPNEDFLSVSRGQAGRVWATGRYGLLLRSEGKWRRFNERDGLLAEQVNFVLEMRSGEIVVTYALERRTSHFRYAAGELQLLQHSAWAERLPAIFSLGEDSRGFLWLGTGRGMIVRTDQGEERFTGRDGLPSEDASNSSFWNDGNGDLWFGTSGGFTRFHGARYAGPVPAPRVWVTAASIGTLALRPLEHLEVPHDANSFSARFVSSSFYAEGKTQYQVKLSGIDADFQPTLGHEVRYPGLPHGHYVFSARARVGVGAWGEPTTLSFQIAPAWHQTWFARGAGAVGVATLAWIALRLRTRTLRRRNRALEALVAARTYELRQASLTDPLTGLRNRRFLTENLGTSRRAPSSGTITLPPPLSNEASADAAFVLVDVDYFKAINDSFGHSAGDEVLKQVAVILTSQVRDQDVVMRWGGEEFLILLRNTPREAVPQFAERLRRAIEEHAFDIGTDTPVHPTVSLGFAPWPLYPEAPAAAAWEQVVSLADECLYVAKGDGRNGWVGVVPPVTGRSDQPWPVPLGELIRERSPWLVRGGPNSATCRLS